MKKQSLIISAFLFCLLATGQNHVRISREFQNISRELNPVASSQQVQPGEKQMQSALSPYAVNSGLLEQQVGNTVYDLQSNGMMAHRINWFDDGTIGTVWNMGFDESAFPDRGTGYNYFDGNQWGPMPETRVESARTGWPSYAAWGENGEILCSHSGYNQISQLVLNRRENKGMSDWIDLFFDGPPNPNNPGANVGLLWPSIVSGGVDHSVLHVLALTAPSVNGGGSYYGQEGALLYSRSEDGGDTWSIENHLFSELDSTYYNSILPDSYAWADPKGETLAFFVSSCWMDAVLMKSTDGGDTWTKTIIWEHPYPNWSGTPVVSDTFYCPDNSGAITLDFDGMAHMVFGITRMLLQEGGNGPVYFPYTDGIVYWNEDMPGFSSNVNALNPNDHPDSELIEDYNLVGWTQDMDQNGQIDFLDNLIVYSQLGISTMPQIVTSEYGYVYLVWSSTTEGYNNGLYNYKHLWARSHAIGTDWWGQFVHVTDNLMHLYDECIFPSIASRAQENLIYFMIQYMLDWEPGLAPYIQNYEDNRINVGEYTDGVGIGDIQSTTEFSVSEIFPNPADDLASFTLLASRAGQCITTVTDLAGKQVYRSVRQYAGAVEVLQTIDISALSPGIYMVSIYMNENRITKKLTIR